MSEFGTGLTYCLGLFLEHAHLRRKYCDEGEEDMHVNFWFNCASDHLIEMDIPDTLPEDLRKRLRDFKERMVDIGHGDRMFSKLHDSDIEDAIREAKELLMQIDQCLGARVEEAEWT